MQRKFLYFLVTFQLVILLAYWICYEAITVFLPGLFGTRSAPLQFIFTLFAFGFVLTSAWGMFKDSFIIRLATKIVMVWTGVFMNILFASVLAWIIFSVTSLFGATAPMEQIATALFIAAGIASIVGLASARIRSVTEIKLILPNLPEFWKGKSVALVTDIHAGHILRYGFVKNVVKAINEMKTEAVLISGDYYDGARTDAVGLAMPLKELNAPLGTYFVSGNHDSYRDLAEHLAALEAAGVQVVDGRMVDLKGLQLIGEGYHSVESVESVSAFLKSLEINTGAPSILLKHVPSNLKAAEQNGVSLTLCGHTHKGQTWPFHYLTYQTFRKYHHGLQKFGAMNVFTSSGVGTWGPPMRFGTKSEIVKITFE